MSDNKFSLDDILNEYPKTDDKKNSANFNLDDLLAEKAEPVKKAPAPPVEPPKKAAPPSPMFSEAADKSEKNEPEPVIIRKEKNATNIVLGTKPPQKPVREFTTTMEINNLSEQSNAFEAITEFNSKKLNKASKQSRKNQQKRRQMEGSSSRQSHEPPQNPRRNVDYRKSDFSQNTSSLEDLSTSQLLNELASERPITLDKVPVHTEKPKPQKYTKPLTNEKLSFEDKDIRPLQRPITGNTEMIDGLMKLRKERGSRTSVIPAVSRKSISDINLNLDDKILPNTAQIQIDPTATEIEKLKDLKERRKKKISDFVLVGDEEEEADDEIHDVNEPREIDDFESFEDAPSIVNDISQLKNSLIVRMLILLVASVTSVYIALANDLSLPLIDIFDKHTQTTTYIFINIILGLLSAFVSYTVISCGLTKLFRLKADCDSISALAVVSSLLSAMVSIASPSLVQHGVVTIFVPVAIVTLLFNTFGKLLIVYRTERNFKYISGDYERYVLFTVNEEETATQFTRGALNDFPVLSSMRKTEFVSDFLKTSYSSDIADKFCKIAAPAILIGSAILAIVGGLLSTGADGGEGLFVGLSTFAGSIAMCSSFAILLVVNLPMQRASKKYLEASSVMLSYESVEDFSDTNSVLLDVSQLFPQGMINLSAIKTFSDTRIDEAIVEAASLTNQAGSILKNMFYDIIAGKTEMLNPVESYIYEDSMGLCGWINNKRILLGNRDLMLNHSIEGVPTILREKEYTENGKVAVYLSISGELSAMFVVEIKASLEVQHWLKAFERNRIYVMLRSVDSIISINRLSELFGVSPEMLKVLPFRLHPQFEETTGYTPRQSASMACNGRFPSFASLIVGTKRLRKIATMGLTIQATTIVLGFLLALIMTILSSFSQLTATIALLYNLAWTALVVILQSIRRP